MHFPHNFNFNFKMRLKIFFWNMDNNMGAIKSNRCVKGQIRDYKELNPTYGRPNYRPTMQKHEG